MNADLLTFEPEAHAYAYGGVPVPSVTTILRRVGLIDFSFIRASVLEKARDRGDKVHRLVHYDAEGDLDPASIDPALAPYLEAARAWLFDSQFVSVGVETRLYHPLYQYAGTTDRVGWLDGRPTVMDWKTGRASDAVADLQLAAYAAALRETPPLEWIDVTRATPIQRISVEIGADARYRVHVYRNPNDFPLFLNCLAIYREQERRGLLERAR